MTGEPVTEEDIDEMFGESDTNKDGKIDFDGKIKPLFTGTVNQYYSYIKEKRILFSQKYID